MSTDLKIMAQPSTAGNSCTFGMEPPAFDGVWASFPDRDSAKGSPLAEKLFELEGVARVGISPDTVTVGADGFPDWRVLGKQAGAAIREQHASGESPVSKDILKKLEESAPIRQKIQDLFDNEINPAIAGHGGFVRLLGVEAPRAYVELGGGCQGCGMAQQTLKQGIETRVKEAVPEITELIDHTDHASGSNPYYSGG